jgi:hypothetical protein
MKAARIVFFVAMVAVALKAGSAFQGPPTTFPLSVTFADGLDPQTAALYQNIANTLNGFTGYPVNRANFFAGYVNAGYTIYGWNAVIFAAQQNGNGYLVTLGVAPGMSPSNGRDIIINDLAYSEQYQVNNDGTFAYVGSLDPNNQAGMVSTSLDSI